MIVNIIVTSTPGPADLRSCVKVEVAVLGFPSLIILMVSVDDFISKTSLL